jgi:hypothetical protein
MVRTSEINDDVIVAMHQGSAGMDQLGAIVNDSKQSL